MISTTEQKKGGNPETAVRAPVRTEKQREASRRNGSKSRGPVTAAGKARSRANALKHGILARVVAPRGSTIITDREAFDALVALFVQQFDAQSQAELLHIESMAVGYLRLQRVLGLIEAAMDPPSSAEVEEYRVESCHAGWWFGRERERADALCNALQALIAAAEDGQQYAVPHEYLDDLTDLMMETLDWRSAEIESIEYGIRHTTASEDYKQLSPEEQAEEIAADREKIKCLKREHKQFGPASVGIRSDRHLFDVLAGKKQIQSRHRAAWIDRLRESLEEGRRRRRVQLGHWVSAMRLHSTRAHAHEYGPFQPEVRPTPPVDTPPIDALHRYEVAIRRAIARDLQMLKELRRMREVSGV